MLLRLSASKTMTRADYSALAAPISLSPPAAPGGIGGGSGEGNPNLHPVTSNNVDMSWERYFAARSLVSASAFFYMGPLRTTSALATSRWVHSRRSNQIYPEGIRRRPYVLTVPVDSRGSVSGFEFALRTAAVRIISASTSTHTSRGRQWNAVAVSLVDARRRTRTTRAPTSRTSTGTHRLPIHLPGSAFYSGLDRSTAFYQDSIGNLFGFAFGFQARRPPEFPDPGAEPE